MIADAYGRVRMPNAEVESPILLLASGERCGSTMLQRALMAGGDVFMWGEQGGAVSKLAAVRQAFLQHDRRNGYVRRLFAQSLDEEFIANLSPGDEAWRSAVRACLRTAYGGYAVRWGLKEVRCGRETIDLFRWAFPRTRTVLLVRDIRACMSSVLRWGYSQAMCQRVLRRWCQLAVEFNKAREDLASECSLLKYEDLVEKPEMVYGGMCHFVGIPVRQTSVEAFRLRVADHGDVTRVDMPQPRISARIPAELRRLLGRAEVKRVRRSLGYE